MVNHKETSPSFSINDHLVKACNFQIIKNLLISGFVLCFGGGVLISTIFIHMLGEVIPSTLLFYIYLFQVRESLERAARMEAVPEPLKEYPFAELLVCLGPCLFHIIKNLICFLKMNLYIIIFFN